MNRFRALLVAAICVIPAPLLANGLRIETTRTQVITNPQARLVRVEARATWRNAWRNARNHDAVWLVVKVRGNPRAGWQHARIGTITPGTSSPRVSCAHSADRFGAFCSAATTHRGDVDLPIVIDVDPGRLRDQDIAANTVEAM